MNPRWRKAAGAADASSTSEWKARQRRARGGPPRVRDRELADAVRATVAAQLDAGPRRCWCGQPWPHDWPDKADGAPHPR